MSSIDTFLQSAQQRAQPQQSAAPSTPQLDSIGTTLSKAAASAPSSFKSGVGGVLHAFAHPINAVEGLAKTVLGAILPMHAGGDLQTPINPAKPQAAIQPKSVPQSAPVNAFQQFGNSFLGGVLNGKGIQGLQQKFESDPVGTLLDATLAIDGVGDVSKVADTANPVAAPFKAAGSAIDKIAGESPKLDTQTIANAKDLGVDLPIQGATTNPFVQKAVGFIQSSVFGGKLQRATELAKTKLDTVTKNAVNDLPNAADKAQLGTAVSKSIDSYQAAHDATIGKLYDDFTEEHGNTPATTQNTVGAIKQVLDQYNTSAAPEAPGVRTFLQKTLDNLTYGKENSAVVSNMRKEGFTEDMIQKAVGSTYEPTFNVLKATRTRIGQMLDKNPELGRVYGALSDDRTASLDKVDSAAASKIKTIDGQYKTNVEQMGAAIVKKIQNSTPEEVVNQFTKGDNATSLSKLKEIIDPATFEAIGTSWMSKLVDEADEGGTINPDKFIKAAAKMDESTRNVLLSPTQQEVLAQTVDTMKKVQQIKDAISEGANTGSFIRLRQMINVLGIPGALMLGSVAGIKSVLTLSGSEFLGGQLLGSKLGKTLLTTGVPGAGRAASAISSVGEEAGKAALVTNQAKQR